MKVTYKKMYIRKKTFEKNLFLQDSINIGTNKNNLLLIQNAKWLYVSTCTMFHYGMPK